MILLQEKNEKLKQEVEKLKRDLIELKGNSCVQPGQDNRDDMVKKFEEGSNRALLSNSTKDESQVEKGIKA